MNFVSFHNFLKFFNPKLRFVGFDIGARYIGVSISDDMNRYAAPVLSFEMKKVDGKFRQFMAANSHVIQAAVVGVTEENIYPIQLQLEKVWSLYHISANRVPIILENEDYSTFDALNQMENHKKFVNQLNSSSKKVVDSMSAAVILQRFLERLVKSRGSPKMR